MREILRKIKTKNRVFKKAYKSLYSKKMNWRIILPKEVYMKLQDCLSNNPPNFNLNENIALYYLSLISSVPSYKKDKIYMGGYVNLQAKKLEKVKYNYKKYFDYFVDNGIIERNNKYSNAKGKSFSKSYRYNLKELKNLTFHIFELEILKSQYEKMGLKEKNLCKKSEYLTKWFNTNLTIDADAAILEIQQKLKHTSSKKRVTLKKAENYLRSLKNLYFQEFWAIRNSFSDNRLHTNLENMPKFYRKYVSYNGKILASIDIKNSQPFFLIVLLEMIGNREIEERNNVVSDMIKKYGVCGTMFETLSASLNSKGFQEEYGKIKYDILEGTFYDNLVEYFKLQETVDKDGKEIYKRRFYCKDTKTQPMYEFESKRDVIKRLVLFFLYKNNQENIKKEDKDYLIFKDLYPNFCNVLELLKQNDKKDLPKLLQHLEANCVLDYICKNISEKHPNIPLYTIHDSIITTEDNIQVLEAEVTQHIKDYCYGIMPTLKTEYWCERDKHQKVA